MDTPVLLAILGAQLLMIGGLFKLWWDHIRDCRARAAKDAVMRSDIDKLLHEVGDHETGIRGAMHKLRQDLSPFAVWCQLEMAKRERQ
jgi:hypothetical protein